MERASEALFALKPVTFRYKKGIDPQGIPQFGLVAEEVEAVNPDLVVRDGEGKVNTVRYEAVNAMLLKEHRKVEEFASTVAKQQATIAQQRRTSKQRLANLKQRSPRSSKSRQSKSRR
jgi:septal ring factor EnvC (AmiA/AmiB activator)